MPKDLEELIALVQTALREDIGPGDLTSRACLEPNPALGEIVAKSDGILSGSRAAMTTFQLVDSANKIEFLIDDGSPFKAGDRIAIVDGFNQTLLASERVALNFLGHLSGIATMTSLYCKQLKGTATLLLDTRKTLPGYRSLEKKAVKDGGGENHRFGLYDMVLIKDNHITSSGSIKEAVLRTKEFLKSSEYWTQFEKTNGEPDNIVIEVEVTSELQLREAITAGVDRLLLDNQSIDSLKELVKIARKLNPKIKLEASGNVTLESVAMIASTGVDYISSGAITHSAPASDFSLLFSEVK